MFNRSAYLQYKRDTNRLIYWIIHTSNRLTDRSTSSVSDVEPSPPTKITTPEVSLSTILTLSKRIAAHTVSPPSSICRLFESVIQARQRAYNFFEKIVTDKPDPKIQESNVRHKTFINKLVEAFYILGGKTWKQDLTKAMSEATIGPEEEDDEAFVNKYAYLGTNDAEDLEEGEKDDEGGHRKENKSFKRKPGKKGKGKKKVAKQMAAQPEPSFNDLPLESYRIVDEQSTVTDYLLAIYDLLQEIVELRNYTQGVWRRVIEGKLNSAVAGAMCNMAVAVVKQLQFEIESDFPGNGFFDAILNAITRGDPDKAQGKFHLGLWKIHDDGKVEAQKEVDIDVKECFMAHAYWGLLAFVQDFQKNRTGKPTKAMLAKLNNWDPNLEVKTASLSERTEWRTAYTINWLYDLVVLWSSVVMRRKNGASGRPPEHFVLEAEDWSAGGKWAQHRVIWGPLEFAADITALAMSKPSTDVKPRILPHHVFQMQCIVDSFTISRGWSYYPMKGHVFFNPPTNYDPLQDIKHFQNRPNRGINYSIDVFLAILERDAAHHPALAKRYQVQSEILQLLKEDLNIWLGSSKLAYGLNSLPPSRFSKSDTNGLWKYSPYLCGTGLADALEYMYNYGMLIWDQNPEPSAILHIYNMLRQTGHLKREIDVLEQCIQFFGGNVFAEGQQPTKNFLQAWKTSLGLLDVLGVSSFRRTARKTPIGSTPTNPKDILGSAPKRIFKRRSLLALLKATNWRPEKIAEADLHAYSLMRFIQISTDKDKLQQGLQQKLKQERGSDPFPNIGNVQMPQSNLAQYLSHMEHLKPHQKADVPPNLATDIKAALGIPDDYTIGPMRGEGNIYNNDSPFQLSNRAYLELVERDVLGDICGNVYPLSAVSYLHLMVMFILIFMEFENNGQHMEIVRDAMSLKEPRVTLATWVMQSVDPALLAFMGERMERLLGNLGCGEFSYFPKFVDVMNMRDDGQPAGGALKYEGPTTGDDFVEEQCRIM